MQLSCQAMPCLHGQPLLRLGKQAGVLDGDTGLRGQGDDRALVLGSELRRVALPGEVEVAVRSQAIKRAREIGLLGG